MTNFYNAADGGEIDRQAWLDIAHQHQIPCLMDAAGDLPPIDNLWKYTAMGYDLVCFSGGKGIRGPQNAGLLLGRKGLTDLAAANNNPTSDAIGRGMKVAKEQIVGMVAALDWILEQDDGADQAEYMRRANTIMRAVKDIPTLKGISLPPRSQPRAASHAYLRSESRRHRSKASTGPAPHYTASNRTKRCNWVHDVVRPTLKREHPGGLDLDDATGRCGDRRTLPARRPLSSQRLRPRPFICPAKNFHSELVK